jgi:hypothetical protein
MSKKPIDQALADGVAGNRRVPGHRPGHGKGSTTAALLDARTPVARHANTPSMGSDCPPDDFDYDPADCPDDFDDDDFLKLRMK